MQAEESPQADDDDDFAVRLDTHDSGPPAPPQPSSAGGTAGGPLGFRGGFVPRPSVAPQRPSIPSGEAPNHLTAISPFA